MNMKIALLVLLIFFASAMVTMATGFSMPTPKALGITETIGYTDSSARPTGDPVDSPFPPSQL